MSKNKLALLSSNFSIRRAVTFPQNLSTNGEVCSRLPRRKIQLHQSVVRAAEIADRIDKVTADVNLPVWPRHFVDHFPRCGHRNSDDQDEMEWAKPLVDEGLAAFERGEFVTLEEHRARNVARLAALGE